MFNDAVLDHFRNPRNAGELPDADVTIEVSNPVCGDVLRLAVRVQHRRIVEARFLCRGCTTAIACASLLTEKIQQKTREQLRGVTAPSLSAEIGGLPPATFHGAELAAEAARELAQKLAESPS